jgi:hypothetical protein
MVVGVAESYFIAAVEAMKLRKVRKPPLSAKGRRPVGYAVH